MRVVLISIDQWMKLLTRKILAMVGLSWKVIAKGGGGQGGKGSLGTHCLLDRR